MPTDRFPYSLAAPRFNDPDTGQGKGKPTGTRHLFMLVGLHPGAEPEPLSHLILPLSDALTRWRHLLRQEALLLRAGQGPPQVRLIRADYLHDRLNEAAP